MATFTRAELRNRVLGRLGVLDAGSAPSAEDAADVDTHIQSVLEELYDDGLIPFDLDSDAIPAPYLIPLSFLVALPLVPDYGMQARELTIAAGAERGMRTLRRLKAKPYYGAPQVATYY